MEELELEPKSVSLHPECLTTVLFGNSSSKQVTISSLVCNPGKLPREGLDCVVGFSQGSLGHKAE